MTSLINSAKSRNTVLKDFPKNINGKIKRCVSYKRHWFCKFIASENGDNIVWMCTVGGCESLVLTDINLTFLGSMNDHRHHRYFTTQRSSSLRTCLETDFFNHLQTKDQIGNLIAVAKECEKRATGKNELKGKLIISRLLDKIFQTGCMKLVEKGEQWEGEEFELVTKFATGDDFKVHLDDF